MEHKAKKDWRQSLDTKNAYEIRIVLDLMKIAIPSIIIILLMTPLKVLYVKRLCFYGREIFV